MTIPILTVLNLVAGTWLLVALIRRWDEPFMTTGWKVFDIVLIALNYGWFLYRVGEWLAS